MNNEKEEWASVNGFPYYKISSHGRIMRTNYSIRLNRKGRDEARNYPEKLLRPSKTFYGYFSQYLRLDNGIGRVFFVHQLVASHFIDNPNGFKIVNHKDENGANNKASNLEWCTQSYNIQYSYDSGKHKPRGRKFTDDELKFIATSEAPYSALAEMFKCKKHSIMNIKLGRISKRRLEFLGVLSNQKITARKRGKHGSYKRSK